MNSAMESDEYEVFIASTGWLRRFINRYRLLLRRETTISQHLIDKLMSYIIHIRRIQKHKAENIIAVN